MLRTFHVCWKTSLSKLPAVVAVVAGVTGVAEAVVEKDNRLRTITARVQGARNKDDDNNQDDKRQERK